MTRGVAWFAVTSAPSVTERPVRPVIGESTLV